MLISIDSSRISRSLVTSSGTPITAGRIVVRGRSTSIATRTFATTSSQAKNAASSAACMVFAAKVDGSTPSPGEQRENDVAEDVADEQVREGDLALQRRPRQGQEDAAEEHARRPPEHRSDVLVALQQLLRRPRREVEQRPGART